MPAITYSGDAASKQVSGADKVIIDDQRHTLSFVHFNAQPPSGDHATWLRNLLKAGPETDFHLYKSETDKLGITHFRYRQMYKNTEVNNGVFYVHVKNGNIVSANGEFYSGISLGVQPSVSPAAAAATAKADLKAKRAAAENMLEQPELVVYRDSKMQYHLAWKTDAFSLEPLERYFYFIDAHSGKIAGKTSHLCAFDVQGSANTAYYGTKVITTDSISAGTYRLFESGRNIHTHAPNSVELLDTDNNWTNTANFDNFAYDAHWGIEMTHDFYLNTFGLNGQDGNGMLADVQVHDGLYVNAFWTGSYVAFGDGDAAQYYPLTSLDIVGHEYTHAVTEFSAGLIYSGESGALNESFSDIFGNTMRFLYAPANATWLVGDEIVIPNMGGTPFRNMSNPNQFACADTYGGLFFNNGDIVHYDSGIQNYWYYLLCMGGSGTNDIGNPFSVSGIGINDAIAITYRNLAVYLTPSSTFADARTYAEQSAEDLFGTCSNQLIQTANAWYAVGIGQPFTGSVVAGFVPTPAISCSAPANVSFVNTSYNGTSYFWDFGDGNNSSSASPTHTYMNAGTYNVSLIVTGTGNCIGADTIVINNAVTINNNPGPVPASCLPQTASYCCNYGISNVTFNTINWSSGPASDGYSDFTCADSTKMVAGNFYQLSVTTTGASSSGGDEAISVWIDYNNDGQFNMSNELVYSDNGVPSNVHTATIYTPVTATLNTRLRMRVMSDQVSSGIISACQSPQKGQVEDYMVYFIPNTLPPVANFTANMTTVPVGGTVNFNDLTQNAPTSWNWTFTAGFPSTSFAQNPVNVLYNTAGIYPVKLVAANSFGTDSVTQVFYINVVNSASMCQQQTLITNSGLIFDSGGQGGYYNDQETCSFLIDPCGTNLVLTFNSFDLETGYDFLTIFDGVNTSAPMIGSYTGAALPPTITSNSGTLFLRFVSDWSVTRPGFEATYTSTPSGNTPAASFSYTPSSPVATIPVQFTDQSLYSPTSWSWDFGDATYSTLQNPQHAYAAAGTYNVMLIATNCISSDTTYFTLTVQPVGIMENPVNQFSVFPNPFESGTTVQLGEMMDPSLTRIELCDITGRVVRTQTAQSKTVAIDRGTLNSGMYFLNVYYNGKPAGTQKVVIRE
jgi:Zn-dependent metalloprotease/chitodextrinase